MLAQTVNPAPTSTGINAPTITFPADGTVVVTVSSAAGTPAGSVSLSVDNGAPTSLPLVGGSATFTVPAPAAGDHGLLASYAAQGNFAASSATGNLHVNPPQQGTVQLTAVTFDDGSATPGSGGNLGDPAGSRLLLAEDELSARTRFVPCNPLLFLGLCRPSPGA